MMPKAEQTIPQIVFGSNATENSQGPKRRQGFFSKKVVIFAVLVVILLAGVGVFINIKKGKVLQVKTFSGVEDVSEKIPTPTPFPFHELTIPYLKSRDYSSSMSALQPNSSSASYQSFLVSYDSDGLKINAQLTRPNGEMPGGGWPAIIFVHGYIPPSNYETLSNYSAYVDSLARNGFVVFKIDLRGHGNSEGDASGAYYSGDYVVDTLNAREALKTLDFVNPKRIGLWGHSMAGNVTFRSFVVSGGIPALVIWAGAVYSYEDWQEYGLNDNSYRPPSQISERQRRRQMLFDTYGEFNSQSEFWKQIVPTNYLEGLNGAIQLNHAVNDDVVDIGYSRDLTKILDKTTIIHELNEYSSGGHNISGSIFNEAMKNTVEFYKNNL